MFILDFAKILILIILTAIFPGKICCNFSYKYKVKSSLKPRFFWVITTLFLLGLLLCGQDFWKKKIDFPVWNLLTTAEQTGRNSFCNWKNISTPWKTWSLALQIDKFLIHLQFFKVDELMAAKHEHLIHPEKFPDKVSPDVTLILQMK